MMIENEAGMEKLVGAGRQGDFVHNNQKMASEDGFKNVSKIWLDKTITFEQAKEKFASLQSEREDIRVLPKDVQLFIDEENVRVGIKLNDKEYQLTEHAWRQFATRSTPKIPHTFVNDMLQGEFKKNKKVTIYRDSNDAKIFHDYMSLGLKRFDQNQKYLFRTYKDGTCRAVLSSDYAIIDNDWYLNALSVILPGGRVSHFDKCDADSLNFNILIPDSIREESDSDYGGMISVGNSEIGTRAFEQYPSVFRAICMNGCIWDKTVGKSARQIHKGKMEYKELAMVLKDNIHMQIPLTTECLNKMMEVKDWSFGKAAAAQVLCEVIDYFKFNAKQGQDLFAQYAIESQLGHKNAFGVINAITRVSQLCDTKEWVNLDKIAGDIVYDGQNKWGKLITRAEQWDEESMKKLLSRSAKENTQKFLAV